jgi:hypothetical protein
VGTTNLLLPLKNQLTPFSPCPKYRQYGIWWYSILRKQLLAEAAVVVKLSKGASLEVDFYDRTIAPIQQRQYEVE